MKSQNKKKVAIGGLGELAERIIRYLHNDERVEIVGIDTMTDRHGQHKLDSLIEDLRLPAASYEQIVKLQPDIFLSLSYLKIIGNELLKNSDCINLHVAKLPEYKGRNPFTYAIQNGERRYYTTLHKMTNKLDSGNIIAEDYTIITINDTAETLYNRMIETSYIMFLRNWNKILKGRYKEYPQKGKSRIYKKELDKKLNNCQSLWDAYNKIRSLDFPPYEPAYLEFGDQKLYARAKDVDLAIKGKKTYVRGILFKTKE